MASYKCRRLKIRLGKGPVQEIPDPVPPPEEPPPPPPPPPPPDEGPGESPAGEYNPPPPPLTGELDLDFTAPILDPKLTVTRAGVQSYLDNDGVLKFAAANVWPRQFSPAEPTLCLGRWLEPNSSNLYATSDDWADGTVVNAAKVVGPVGKPGPDGADTEVMELHDDAVAGDHYFQYAGGDPGGTRRGVAVWVKADGWTRAGLMWVNSALGSGFYRAEFELAGDGTLFDEDGDPAAPFTAKIEAWPNGWYRISIESDGNLALDAAASIRLNLINDSAVTSFAGDGTKGLLFYGLHLQDLGANEHIGTYVRTTGTAASRGEPEIAFNTLSWLDTSKGTYQLEFTPKSRLTDFPRLFYFHDGAQTTTRLLCQLRMNDADPARDDTFEAEIYVGNVLQTRSFVPRATQGPGQLPNYIVDDITYQAGFAYEANDAVAGINAVLGARDSALTPPTALTQGWLGWNPGVVFRWSGLIRRFRYRPEKLSDANLLSSGWFGAGSPPSLNGTNPARVRWAPKPQINPTYVQVNPDGTLNPQRTFGATEDVYVVCPTNVVVDGDRTVTIRGGRRVRFTGGELINELNGAAGTVLRFENQTEQVFIEGTIGDKKGSKGDVLAWSLKPACDLIVQNCHFAGVAGDSATHGDLAQIQGPVRHIMIDKLTGDTTFQGLLLPGRVAQDGVSWGIGAGFLSRINLKLTNESFSNNWHLLYLRDGCTGINTIHWPVTLEDVWLDPLTRDFSLAFQPNATQGTCGATVDQDPDLLVDRATWPAGENIAGQANKGAPPGGDFVPRSNVGRGYVSPGYLEHPYVTDIPVAPAPPPAETTKIVYAHVKPGLPSPVTGVDDVYGPLYTFRRFRELYREPWDPNLDGKLASGWQTTSAFNNMVNAINNAAYIYVSIDWEKGSFEVNATGTNGASAQTAALADAVALTTELKNRCPGKKFGWYFLPRQNESWLDTPVNSILADTPSSMASLWQVVDFISPDIYQRFKVTASGAGEDEISEAVDLERQTNFADLCLECAEVGTNVEVIPHVSNFYLSNSGNVYNNTIIPIAEFHKHVRNFCQTVRNGKKPAGVMWWHGGSSFFTNVTEAQVKAMYQAANDMNYVP